jgi:DNA mismatch repair protein MutL
VANQIAAGEVVQRPSSVVKELLENALDAGSSQIQLVIKDAGRTLIQVIDNGKGMSMLDARMAFERHATSKISTADDLFNLHTKGFRGEALASIAAIAHVGVKTCEQESDLGTHLIIEGSKVISQEPVVTPQGTIIDVKNLFYNVPARRKFLKSDTVELRHVIDEFHRVALAHPNVGFKLVHNDSELFHLPVAGLKQRIIHVMGSRTNDKLLPVNEETELVKISGFIGKPEFTRKTRGLQYFFVNDRFIKHSYLHHAVVSAYEGLLREKENPSYFIYLDVPRDSVDINIHPTKTEVKFDDEHTLYTIIRASVKHALGQFSLNKIDFNKEREYEVPYEVTRQQNISSPRIEVDPDFNPFRESGTKTKTESSFKPASGFRNEEPQPQWEALYSGLNSDPLPQMPESQTGLFENQDQQPTVFQLQNKFIIKPLVSGLLIVHQRNAHVRVLYEQLLKKLEGQNGVSQQLLFPIFFEMNQQEIQVLQNCKSELELAGFQFKSLEADQVQLEGIPLELKESEVSRVLESVVMQEELELPNAQHHPQSTLALKLAKGMAVRSGDAMEPAGMNHLLDQLFGCAEPTITPQGKRTFDKLTGDQLASKFN